MLPGEGHEARTRNPSFQLPGLVGIALDVASGLMGVVVFYIDRERSQERNLVPTRGVQTSQPTARRVIEDGRPRKRGAEGTFVRTTLVTNLTILAIFQW